MSSISKEQFLKYLKERKTLDKHYGELIVNASKLKEARDEVKNAGKSERLAEKLADPEHIEKLQAQRRGKYLRKKERDLLVKQDKPVEPVSQGSDEVFLSDEELARPPAENLPQLKQEIKHIQRKFFNYM